MGQRCFICRARLVAVEGPRKRTLEHLIPQWIIRRHGLTDATVNMGALGPLRYMDYLLPCCAQCNSHLLAPIERAVSRSLKQNELAGLAEERLAPWVAKIILGAQAYDRAERLDRSPSTQGERLIRRYLAGLRGQVIVEHFNQFEYPMSLFWFRTLQRADPRRNFDFQVSPYLQALYLRLGHWSFLARADAGYVRRNGAHVFLPFQQAELAPLQMEELAAHFFTMAELAKHDHLVRRERLPSGRIRYTHLEMRRREPFYPSSDDGREFLGWFSHFTGAEPSDLLMGPGRRRTFLPDDSGQLLHCPAEEGWH